MNENDKIASLFLSDIVTSRISPKMSFSFSRISTNPNTDFVLLCQLSLKSICQNIRPSFVRVIIETMLPIKATEQMQRQCPRTQVTLDRRTVRPEMMQVPMLRRYNFFKYSHFRVIKIMYHSCTWILMFSLVELQQTLDSLDHGVPFSTASVL